MAQSQVLPPPIEFKAFVKNLYDYIWGQHKFRTPVLVRIYADLNRLAIEQDEGNLKSHHFTVPIGKAVLHSQYLLREYCQGLFQRFESDVLHSGYFMHAVFIVVYKWIGTKKNVFIKFIAAAAIIAEAILFCDAETDVFRELDEANKMFIAFFERKLSEEFYAKGGWIQLQELVMDKFSFISQILEPRIKYINIPYQKLEYSCDLIKRLRSGFVTFPVNCSHICKKCENSADDVYGFNYDNSLVKLLMTLADSSRPSAEKMELDLELFPNNKEKLSAPSEFDFLCVFLGNDEKETFETETKNIFLRRKHLTK